MLLIRKEFGASRRDRRELARWALQLVPTKNASERMRDLIRRDKERAEKKSFERLKAELAHARATPESSYKPLTAADAIARNRV